MNTPTVRAADSARITTLLTGYVQVTSGMAGTTWTWETDRGVWRVLLAATGHLFLDGPGVQMSLRDVDALVAAVVELDALDRDEVAA